MPYTVSSSEKLRKSGADAETKAMLYLMSFREDSSEIDCFVVDFFNDVTGMDRLAQKLWDIQSKATKKANAKEIGRELVTLYKNYMSDFRINFMEYILFIGGVPSTFRVDPTLKFFDISNIKDDALNRVRSGLKEECEKKQYIAKSDISDLSIDKFLNLVLFVVDDGLSPQDYVREIVKRHSSIRPADNVLVGIFNEIRDKQASLKNSIVEGIKINRVDEALIYGRELRAHEIKLLILQRLINTDPLSKGVPVAFMEIYSKYPEQRRKMLLENCQSAMCRALFNNSLAKAYWALFDHVYSFIVSHPNHGLDEVTDSIPVEIKSACTDFDVVSIKYFVAKIKEGVEQ